MIRQCEMCGDIYDTEETGRYKYCSAACNQRARKITEAVREEEAKERKRRKKAMLDRKSSTFKINAICWANRRKDPKLTYGKFLAQLSSTDIDQIEEAYFQYVKEKIKEDKDGRRKHH